MITTLEGARVLVTGVSGFIGSHLARRLLREGARVHGLVRESSGLWRLQDVRERLELHYADLTDFESVSRVVHQVKPLKIFHLAARVDVSRTLALVDEMVEVNVKGTLNLVQVTAEAGCDCFVNTGTSEEYGDNPVPFREDQVPNPVSPYSASKAASTMFCRMLHKTMGVPVVTLRPFLTYGPGQESDMLIPSLIRKALKGEALEMTEGKQTREFNYVSDVVDGFVRASICPQAAGEIINIGNGQEYRIRDVVELVLQLTQSKMTPQFGALSYRPGEAWHFYCDNTKAKQLLGWEPKVTLENGMKMTIEWFGERQLQETEQ
ncbi:MAG: SDR family NAD(P)-dependent oxidoreductase [Chloroflexi bacterium]|nr:SDR family NAD(P)-dependent oxidoreductase [Chloroflexota bacterium]